MKQLTNINEIEIIIRTELIKQSQLNAMFVRNALSLHGEALDKFLSEQTFVSIDTDNVLLLFELQNRNNDSDMTETENDDSVSYYKSFRIYCILYGDNSTNIANNIVARFRTQRVRDTLQNQGIYLESVSDADRINEYKNETMWIRNDISIDISCHLSIQQIDVDSDMTELSGLQETII